MHAVAALDGDEVLAVGFVCPDGGLGEWRVRGMATAPEQRGRGIGAAILDALVEHARSQGATRVWCNARTPALRLYERAGFERESGEFEIPGIGLACRDGAAGLRPAPRGTGGALLTLRRVKRRTKIVATIGPASRDPETLVRMVEAGMDVARLNFSHGSHEQHAETAELVRDAAGRAGRPVALLQDLPGPEAAHRRRSSRAPSSSRPATRSTSSAARTTAAGDARAHVDHAGRAWPARVEPGEVLYLADGAVRLRATAVRAGDREVEAEVEIGGTVASRQGLNIPGPGRRAAVGARGGPRAPGGRQPDRRRHGGVELRAPPRGRAAVREHTRVPLIAKIEKPQAVDNAEEIVRVSDCVMVARGDLGIELPIEEVPIVQKKLIALAGALARPVDHRDADARLDGHLLAPDARRGGRRRQRDPRRHRRHDAVPGDGGRRPPGRRRSR